MTLRKIMVCYIFSFTLIIIRFHSLFFLVGYSVVGDFGFEWDSARCEGDHVETVFGFRAFETRTPAPEEGCKTSQGFSNGTSLGGGQGGGRGS